MQKPPLAVRRMVRGGGIFEENDGRDLLQVSEYSEIGPVRIPSGPPGQPPLCPREALGRSRASAGPAFPALRHAGDFVILRFDGSLERLVRNILRERDDGGAVVVIRNCGSHAVHGFERLFDARFAVAAHHALYV